MLFPKHASGMDLLSCHQHLGMGKYQFEEVLKKLNVFCPWIQAVGSEGELLPDHVGIPLGEHSGGADYFMLETHYDNPAMHSDISDHSGLR